MKVIFLGTGCAVPTLKRNLSSVALIREGEVFLFDCGEGTQIQLQKTSIRPSKIGMICITHFHGDHLLGLMGLLMSLQQAGHTRPITLVGPPGLQRYVEFNKKAMVTRFTYPLEFIEVRSGPVVQNKSYEISTLPMTHRLFTLGFLFKEKTRPGLFFIDKAQRLGIPEGPLFGKLQRGESVTLPSGKVVCPEEVLGPPRPGRSMAYCIDTIPCENAVELARDVDLLIHEGTFGQDLEKEAQQKTHSTVAQAAQIAKRANAKQLIITHISARYGNPKPLLLEARSYFEPTKIAYDLMETEVLYKEEEEGVQLKI